MSSKSKNNIRDQKTLKGYVVLLERSNGMSLALNFGPTMVGKAWNFDWIGRATVFKTKSSAVKTIKKEGMDFDKEKMKIVPLKSIAVLIPEVNSQFKVYYHAEPKDTVQSIKKRVQKCLFSAEILENEAKQRLDLAETMRKRAAILKNL